LDGFDTAAIGFIAPDIRTHWQLSASELAPLFGAGLLGLTAGAPGGGYVLPGLPFYFCPNRFAMRSSFIISSSVMATSTMVSAAP
ncbi:hypothetical protein ONJ23_27660, partial [Salmonella enterica subsp. enterica serovar Virginia]|nr:hypothetical protein [Salmonella enterica subsp. enterica serovar Virginia]